MLTFLRKIRKSLIESGSTRKYLLYAIGEIGLVVIGILIALQINNWNEGKKMLKKEIEIYQEIHSELKESLEDIEDDLDDLTRNMNATIKIRNMFIGQNVSKDSFMYYMPYVYDKESTNPKTSAFESLKSLGLDILSNDTIRQNITTLYQLRVSGIRNSYSINESARYRRNIEVLFNPYLKINSTSISNATSLGRGGFTRDLRHMIIDDFNSLLEDAELSLAIQKSILLRWREMHNFRRTAEDMQKVMTDIENELVRIQ